LRKYDAPPCCCGLKPPARIFPAAHVSAAALKPAQDTPKSQPISKKTPPTNCALANAELGTENRIPKDHVSVIVFDTKTRFVLH
jgi:hypothetical protein